MASAWENGDRGLLSSEAAALLHVSSKTVARWAKEGLLPFQRTLGGHRRYSEKAIKEIAASLQHGHMPERQVAEQP